MDVCVYVSGQGLVDDGVHHVEDPGSVGRARHEVGAELGPLTEDVRHRTKEKNRKQKRKLGRH